MKFKIIYNKDIYIEAEATSEEERKVCVKGIKHTLEDLNLATFNFVENIQTTEHPESTVEKMATTKQKEYLDKLEIKYSKDLTMVQAADLIRNWKIAHGYPGNPAK